MNEKYLFTLRIYITGIVVLFIWGLLIWTHFHGGVPSHHLLDRKDLPSISNWWGGLWLPLLTWLLLYRIQSVRMKQPLTKTDFDKSKRAIVWAFLGSLLFGIMMSLLFTLGYETVLGYLIYVLLILALLFPIFRSEYILGFVIGMTVTFGAILPSAFALVIALASVVLYKFIRPLLLYLVQLVRK